MTSYLLVHGAVHGGWVWRSVAQRLRAVGHVVHAPTLTGTGERLHLTNPTVNLETHIADLLAVVEYEELDDLVVVAHSYGGLPVTGLLDRCGERVRRAVYLDAMVGRDGDTALDGLDPDLVATKLAGSAIVNGTRVLQPLDAVAYGLDRPEDITWVQRRVTTQPESTYTQRLRLHHPTGNGRPCRYLRCMEPCLASFDRHEDAASELGWSITRLPAGHDAMVSHPKLVTAAILDERS